MSSTLGPSATTPIDSRSGAWVDASIDKVEAAARLSGDQPGKGLLWVTRGRLHVRTATGGVLEVPQGTVVSYRLGDGLQWTAGPGTRVRWCLREVSVLDGEAETWTPGKSPDEAMPAVPRRRPWMSFAAILLVWIAAAAVAWCYGRAQAGQVTDFQSRALKAAPVVPGSAAALDDAAAAFESAGFVLANRRAFLMEGAQPRRVTFCVETATASEAAAMDQAGSNLPALARTLAETYFPSHRVVEAIEVIPSIPLAGATPAGGPKGWGPRYRVRADGTVTRR